MVPKECRGYIDSERRIYYLGPGASTDCPMEKTRGPKTKPGVWFEQNENSDPQAGKSFRTKFIRPLQVQCYSCMRINLAAAEPSR
jgi:hypothetical protein